MEILLSHNNLDFDGLASLLGAKKLYPNAQIVLAGRVSTNIQEFFALHKDALPYKFAHQIDQESITGVVLVDIADAKRLGPLKGFVSTNPDKVIAVYDHHPAQEGDFAPGAGKVEIIGAATTILVEELKSKNIEISPFEATLLALGIYEDTGGLIFSGTTARDIYAAGYLLEKGANLGLIANFMDRPISTEQRELLNKLLTGQKTYHIHGYKVLLAACEIKEYIAGLNIVTHQMAEISNADLIFSVVMMEDRIHLVARSRVDGADVGEIAEAFGGGGHAKASSAVIKTTDLSQVIERLLQILKEKIVPAVTAGDIMTSPVKTLTQDISVQEAGKIMLRYGHTGLPIVEDRRVVGIISRRDLDKARHHALGHAPVKAFMSRNVQTITPETPLAEIRALMMEKDIGRLPVVKNEKIVGIVSRTDILKTLHGENLPISFSVNFVQACPLHEIHNLADLMLERLPENVYRRVAEVGQIADEYGYDVYLVGGLVRDLLLNLPNYDLDIVVEGDGIAFATILGEKLGAKVRAHEKFSTAVLLFPDGEKIDIATARTEFYEFPAALPTVETSSLKQDLYRRDFTVNAMAVSINAWDFGQFIDYFNGKSDLDKKLIRVLYNLSFIEDPTRIIRAVRFEQRYGFVIEEQTMAFAQHAIENNLIEKLSYHRIREELELILHELNPLPALHRMQEIGLWSHIMPEINLDDKAWQALVDTHEFLMASQISQRLNKAILYLCSIFAYVEQEEALAVLERFQWTKKERDIVQEFLYLRQKVNLVETYWLEELKAMHLQLKEYSVEAIVALSALVSGKQRQLIHKYCERRFKALLEITGEDLSKFGIKPGPRYGKILTNVLAAKISGEVHNKEEELTYVKKLLELDNIDA